MPGLSLFFQAIFVVQTTENRGRLDSVPDREPVPMGRSAKALQQSPVIPRLFNNLQLPAKRPQPADELSMSTSPINNLTSSDLQQILSTSLQGTGLTTSPTSTGVSATSTQSDNGQLSPFAQQLSTLQQLEESNPTQYQQVTAQIATNLQSAAQTATADGNTSAASQLNQLATDFNNASQSGQLPNISDLAQAIGGGGGHHHQHRHVSSSSSSSNTSSDSSSSSSSSTNSTSSSDAAAAAGALSYQWNSAQNQSFNPMSIIMNTLQSAGITPTNS
jgi:hypothetical protein